MADNENKNPQSDSSKPTTPEAKTEGKAAADTQSGYVATLVTYHAMLRKADEIAEELKKIEELKREYVVDDKKKEPHLLIVDSLDLQGLYGQLIQVKEQIEFWNGKLTELNTKLTELEREVENITKPVNKMIEAAPVALASIESTIESVKGIVSSIAEILRYLSVEYEIKGQKIELDNTALQGRVAGKIAKHGVSVYLPAFHLIPSSSNSTLTTGLKNCIDLKKLIEEHIKNLRGQVVKIQAQSGITDQQKGKIIKEIEEACKKAEEAITGFDEFHKVVISVPRDSTYSPLASALIWEHLNTGDITHLLYLKVISSGGEMVIGKGLFQSGRVGFLGGCVISYILARRDGKIVAANTIFGSSNAEYKLDLNNLSEFRSNNGNNKDNNDDSIVGSIIRWWTGKSKTPSDSTPPDFPPSD